MNTIVTPKAETFYWVTILFSQTLGTALGDWVTDPNDLGYGGGAILSPARSSAFSCFTPPRDVARDAILGRLHSHAAARSDVRRSADKPVTNGGFEISRYLASAILAGLIVALIAVLPKRAGVHPARMAKKRDRVPGARERGPPPSRQNRRCA